MSQPHHSPNESINCIHQSHFHQDHDKQGKKVWLVLILTLVTMVVEIGVGLWSGSMALLADGWHMSTHAAAFTITLFTYWYANKHKSNQAFSFGTGKVTALGGFASAIGLAIVALLMAAESIERIINPNAIHFNEAIGVAIIGLLVNIASVFILHDDHHHHDAHSHQHGHNDHHHEHSHHHGHDHNLKAAYFHVLADALTSILAILALLAGKYFNIIWMDAVMGIIGGLIILKWAYNLVCQTSETLLDKAVELEASDEIKTRLAKQFDAQVTDFHIWRLADKHNALIVSLQAKTDSSVTVEQVKTYLKQALPKISHATVEIQFNRQA
ncbi:CDF family Co(II)/Ni(II) efflux transporter DmeF [Catenovulum sp. 2E275]|uniref:CDF family Co(II)/Ni(II) efflux transporter DmeF n=1 Tax=Catenovulum sp. 2E275 TaxID=2980497 RepID=UPI0021D180E7|nr:CDF family Co(II)/Ni(II) efflux transporter DmeF [Catenovulum sp. 2E275]MCU4676521.1 CDF family Co(II)/Ni(II) efflux transporter DmeF [Catenovulum sp. 2E275]